MCGILGNERKSLYQWRIVLGNGSLLAQSMILWADTANVFWLNDSEETDFEYELLYNWIHFYFPSYR